MVQVITTGGVPLGAAQTHQHLGRLLACNDNDWPVIQTQLKKARSRWGSLSRILVREGATPGVSGMFHKAVVQAVLLCGCESWVLTDKVWKVLASFHDRAARRIARKMPYEVGEVWIHPPLEEAREDAGVHTIQHCAEKRQNRVAMCVASRPIWPHCVGTDANPDISASQIMWWTKVLRNQTKVTAHLSNMAGESIALCSFNLSMPSEAERAACAFRGSLLIAGLNSRTFKAEVIDNHLSDHHDAVIRAADVRKGTSSVRGVLCPDSRRGEAHSSPGNAVGLSLWQRVVQDWIGHVRACNKDGQFDSFNFHSAWHS